MSTYQQTNAMIECANMLDVHDKSFQSILTFVYAKNMQYFSDAMHANMQKIDSNTDADRKKLPEDIYKIFGMNKHLIMITILSKKNWVLLIWQVRIWYFWSVELQTYLLNKSLAWVWH
eukprot:375614_1